MGTYADAREKTRNNLIHAFWDLYCEKDINKITIKEITDRAGYNRATFYIYFKNTRQVLDYVEEQLYDMLSEPEHKPRSFEEAQQLLEQSIQKFDQNSRFLCVLLSEKGDPQFASDFRQYLRRIMNRVVELGELEPTVPLEFALDFAIGGITSSLQHWYERHPNTSSKQLIENILHSIFHGMLRRPSTAKTLIPYCE
ncbi:MAG: TetR/AcrR family transcriptional regulator [Butyricicoccus sp.]